MIIFSTVEPKEFTYFIGQGPLSFIKKFTVLNMMSYDIRFQKVNRLIPTVPNISEEAFKNDESAQFEAEYFHYLDNNEAAFLDIMKFMIPEFTNGSENLILIQMMPQNQFCESITMSLIKYIYLKYGVTASIIKTPEDLLDLRLENSIFSLQGLAYMDHNISVLKAICPEILSEG